MNSLKRVIIFGATSAIATHTARQLVAQGAALHCVGRNPEKLDALIDDLKVRAGDSQYIGGTVADLTDRMQHDCIIRIAEKNLGGIDGVLIAYGSLPDQLACQADARLTIQEIETNSLSVINLLTLLANRFEFQEHGVIAVISSVAGDRGRKSNYVYGAAKGMVSIFLQGLRNRLVKFNVDVVTIKPGFVDTPMTAGFDKSGILWAKPGQVAAGIIKSMKKGSGEVYLPWFWWGIIKVLKCIPDFIFKRMSL
ncbi:SDR family oxidoreductase [Halomonas sp. H10-59]|uniref:SDR family oxidoreductase n=1 Tax=Halomonas sp. H10-59 TaxID=2950874 RepID=A0AAU7KZ85_9GAMM